MFTRHLKLDGTVVLMKLFKIKQRFDGSHIPESEIDSTVTAELTASGVAIAKGAKIAIAVGSRGIANLPQIVRSTVQWVKQMGGRPFLVPAMGSHGGASAGGQRRVLESYGVTEDSVGAPIRSSMEVIELPQGELNSAVYMDKLAYEADGTIVINRIKLHTAFHGAIESGLMKMCAIGLGKHKGALEIHRCGAKGLRELIPPTAGQILQHGNILLGLAIVENAYEQSRLIKAVRPENFETEESVLLQVARENMPSLPVQELDVLIVDEFGKHISGTGMDVNIIGRLKINTEPEPESPRIGSIILLDLADKSHGNANGMGLADVMSRRFFEKIDFQATYENVLTTGFLERGKIPVVAETEAQTLEFALKSLGLSGPEQARVLRIKNSLSLDTLWASSALLPELKGNSSIERLDEMQEFGGLDC
ncbi:MAG: DUF362 domain-containing protein [bacterium]|nr:DUF362 domain-containing protein [bacterium]